MNNHDDNRTISCYSCNNNTQYTTGLNNHDDCYSCNNNILHTTGLNKHDDSSVTDHKSNKTEHVNSSYEYPDHAPRTIVDHNNNTSACASSSCANSDHENVINVYYNANKVEHASSSYDKQDYEHISNSDYRRNTDEYACSSYDNQDHVYIRKSDYRGNMCKLFKSKLFIPKFHFLIKPKYLHQLSHKKHNKNIKIKNGNGKNTTTISHWNLGSKRWQNKIALIQAMVDSSRPDLIFISEANLYELTPDYATAIVGYKIVKPLSVELHGLSRIVLLIKTDFEVKIEKHLMDPTVASIWVNIAKPGMKKVLVSGVYCEHQYLDQVDDSSLHPGEQLLRWNKYLAQVEKAASNNTEVHLIGDFNMDFLRWNNPAPNQVNLVTCSKNILELNGFAQLMQGITRAWPGQVSSQIDHIWTNTSNKIQETTNVVKASGDHNLITLILRNKGKKTRRL